MSRSIETQGIFKPSPNKQESKADTTTNVARSIATAELSAREAKTARLRAARLKAEAEAPPPEPKKKPASRAKKTVATAKKTTAKTAAAE